MDMEESMLRTLLATICQSSLSRMKTSQGISRKLFLQHSSKLILLLQKHVLWMLPLLLAPLPWQLLLWESKFLHISIFDMRFTVYLSVNFLLACSG